MRVNFTIASAILAILMALSAVCNANTYCESQYSESLASCGTGYGQIAKCYSDASKTNLVYINFNGVTKTSSTLFKIGNCDIAGQYLTPYIKPAHTLLDDKSYAPLNGNIIYCNKNTNATNSKCSDIDGSVYYKNNIWHTTPNLNSDKTAVESWSVSNLVDPANLPSGDHRYFYLRKISGGLVRLVAYDFGSGDIIKDYNKVKTTLTCAGSDKNGNSVSITNNVTAVLGLKDTNTINCTVNVKSYFQVDSFDDIDVQFNGTSYSANTVSLTEGKFSIIIPKSNIINAQEYSFSINASNIELKPNINLEVAALSTKIKFIDPNSNTCEDGATVSGTCEGHCLSGRTWHVNPSSRSTGQCGPTCSGNKLNYTYSTNTCSCASGFDDLDNNGVCTITCSNGYTSDSSGTSCVCLSPKTVSGGKCVETDASCAAKGSSWYLDSTTGNCKQKDGYCTANSQCSTDQICDTTSDTCISNKIVTKNFGETCTAVNEVCNKAKHLSCSSSNGTLKCGCDTANNYIFNTLTASCIKSTTINTNDPEQECYDEGGEWIADQEYCSTDPDEAACLNDDGAWDPISLKCLADTSGSSKKGFGCASISNSEEGNSFIMVPFLLLIAVLAGKRSYLKKSV